MIKHQMRITTRIPGQEPISIAEFKSVQSVEIREEENDEVFGNANQSKTI